MSYPNDPSFFSKALAILTPIRIKRGLRWLAAIVLVWTLASVGCSAAQTVPAGSRGVMTHFGKVQPGVLDEGLYFLLPFRDAVHLLSVRVQKTEAHTEAASKDLQKVSVKLALNWNIDPMTVQTLFQQVGTEENIVARIIDPAVSEVLKAASAKLTAEEILTKRIELKQTIDDALKTRLATYNILVRDVALVDLDFTPEFNHAVEAKQIAEQLSQQAEYEANKATIDAKAGVNKAKGEAEASVTRAEADATSMLTRAKAEAESNALKQKTLTQELIRYETVRRWDGKLPSVTGGPIPFITLPKPE